MLSTIPKNAILRKKAPSKLSLKKNIRRSSILDKKAIPLRNDSLIDKNTSSGTISLFSSSDDDIFETSDDDKQTKCSGSTKNNASVIVNEIGSDVQFSIRKSDNFSFIFSNLRDDKERCHVNEAKNESVELMSSTCEKQSLILKPPTSIIIDNSTDSLFSFYRYDSLEAGGNDFIEFRNKLGGILNYKFDGRSPHTTSFEEEKSKMNSEEKKAVNNSVIVISPTIDDQLDDSDERNQHMEMLDKLYGREWRKAEKLVFSEPRPNRPLKTKINAPKTEIKPRKQNKCDKNDFPNGKKKANKSPVKKNLQNFYDSSDTSEENSEKELKTVKTTLFPKVVRKPVESPWVQRLQNLCDSDTSEEESEKENKYNNEISSKIKNKLNYDSFSTITSDSSNLDSSFITLSDDSCNSNSFSNINRKTVKTKRLKKSRKVEESDEEKEEEIEDKRGSTPNIFNNKKVVFGTPRVDKREKAASVIKHLPSLNTSEIIHKSFIESLSASVPLNQCHPTARIFRNNYQAYKMQLTEKLFKLFNEKIFNNLIPDDNSVFWNVNLTKTAGYCKYSSNRNAGQTEKKIKIFLSVKVLDSPERLRCTLLHEMIHAVCMISGTHDHHGPNFKAWGQKAVKVFPGLPPVTRCHSYDVKAKYTYKCLSCGFCKNRHSKSIDITKKVCGRCHGKFELFINKTAQGEKKRVPVTPKTPSGFALFVKNNYAQCRTPELKHGEVMKLLGSKFNELKLSGRK